jgi:anaerobic magnesium-protoporphyrin IX monomethyl ester cyclase
VSRRVWFHETWNFLFRDRRVRNGPSLAAFWGAPQDAEEEEAPSGCARERMGVPAPHPERQVAA